MGKMQDQDPIYHYFYVLWCKDQTIYAGYTNRLSARMQAHNAGKGAKYTKPLSRRPICLLYAERWPDKRRAMQREYWFKQLSRQEKLTFLYKQGITDMVSGQSIIRNRSHEEGEDKDASTKEF